MLRDCGMFSVVNRDTLSNFVELDKIVIKGTMVAHLHKTRESKVRISTVMAIIKDRLLDMMQAPPTDLGPSNSQDIKFKHGVIEPHHDESISFHWVLKTSKANGHHTPMPLPMS
jgi:hypothetical protein